MPRVSACCGDALCEGGESVSACGLDCQDTDQDGFADIAEGDDDNDGLSDDQEAVLGTNPLLVDSDGDGLVDGAGGLVPLAMLPGGVDADTDGFVDGEADFATSPVTADTDGDQLDDGIEVANGSDPTDPASYPTLADADLAPFGEPDGQVNAGDLLVAMRILLDGIPAGTLQLAHGDMDGDHDIDLADIILIQAQVLAGP
jgi:hypothetical protein